MPLIQNDQTWLKHAEAIFRAARKPEEFGRLLCNWEPHPGQIRWLNRPTVTASGLKIVNYDLITGRRWGKTEAEAVDTLYYALFHPDTRQGIVSITLDQARLSWDRAVAMATNSPILSPLVYRIKETPFPLLVFKNRSSIAVRTAAREGIYIRGHKFDRVVVDEADYLDESIIDDVVRMTLADVGGPLILCSTPRAKRGLCYKLQRSYEQSLESGIECDIYSQTGPSFENPHLDHDYINGLREKLTRDGWKREIEGIYADDDAAVFRYDDIQWGYFHNPGGPAPTPQSFPEAPKPNRRYCAGWDLAKSIDHTVGFVLDVTTLPYRVVYYERTQRMPWPAITKRIQEIHNRYHCYETWYDATGIGGYVTDELDGFCMPFIFTKQSKVDLITSLQLHLEKHRMVYPFIRQVVDELQDYEWDDKAISDTDCVMALALAGWMGGGNDVVEAIPIPNIFGL